MPMRSPLPCLALASVTHVRSIDGDVWSRRASALDVFALLRLLARGNVRCAFPLAFAPNGPAALRAVAMARRPVRVVRGI